MPTVSRLPHTRFKVPWRKVLWWRHPVAAGVCLLLGLLLATTARVANGTDLSPNPSGDKANLLRAEQARLHNRQVTIQNLRQSIRERTKNLPAPTGVAEPGNAGSSPALQAVTGLGAVTGPALTITLSDTPAAERTKLGQQYTPDDFVVHQGDIQGVVNALWSGGAEAMTIMDQRVISTSAVRCVGTMLSLQGREYSPPFVVTAIGPVERMQESLNQSAAVTLYRQYVELVKLGYEVKVTDSLTLPAYAGSLGLVHATVP